MRVLRVAAATVAVGLAVSGCGGSGAGSTGPAATGAFTIAVWGDTPYSAGEAAAVPTLIDQINMSDVAFTVFVGDLQGGARCDGNIYTEAIDRFRSFVKPMVYVPGDNEWTDCHAGGQDPIERLGYLRRTMFASDRSFGKQTITVEQQPSYPENARWTSRGIQFVSVNVPGSNNNHVADPDGPEQGTQRGPADRRAAEAEYQARDQADRDWLHQAFAAATADRAAGVVIAMQADPGFELAGPDRAAMNVDGYDRLLAAFVAEAKAFAKPVVIMHGDSHRERFDHPLVDPGTGQSVLNVSRIESFGSPTVGWVEVTFNPADPAFVSVVPHGVLGPGAGR